ncbi:OmpA family protein [Amnibacterium sp. CER49]|uniref:OmpA family protein n=1 Tax=Amnibacterium sp. CER49 TaxID=3039161 RepID=UPI00244C3CF2|nr:OmpA family protein [Amnibacterium sp. CER49]MDH2444384.1 OmpA family protein [Amnibacterium sp. CER49]
MLTKRRGASGARRVSVVLAALTGLASLGLTGCSAHPAAAPAAAAAPGSGLELVVGVHAGQPAPLLPASVRTQVQAAVAGERAVGLVTVEGAPRVLQPALPMSLTETTSQERVDADRRNVDAVDALVRAARPTTAGADLLASLVTAAKAARSAPDPVDRVVVLDNGLSDHGALDFTKPGMTDAAPGDVVAALLKRQVLTPSTFHGLTVEFVGLGTTIAAPQKRLPASQVAALTAVYTAVVRAGGGTAEVTPLVRSGRAAATDLPVTAVDTGQDRVALGGTSALGDGSSVGFEAGTATFRDPAAARRLLQPLARWLAPGSTHRASVVGTTSSEGTASQQDDLALSQARAQAVKDLLVTLGADPATIEATGKGYIADPPDRVNGVLDPAKAAQNRVVRITTTI